MTDLRVINVGLAEFADVARSSGGAQVDHIDWRPPADGDPASAMRAARLFDDPSRDVANGTAMAAFLNVDPVVIDVQPAHTVMPLLADSSQRRLLHAGPPIEWGLMCGPMQGALIGASIYEGWADSPESATRLLASGLISFGPCHDARAVGPMAGVISPTMPVWVVEDGTSGRRSFSNMNEGLGKVLRFGAHDPAVLERLRWMRDELGPVLGRSVRSLSGIALRPLMAQALHMGDEVHNRNTAATGQFMKMIAPSIVGSSDESSVHIRILKFLGSTDHFFLNLSMAACKLSLDAAGGVAGSTIVTAMARNGVNFGIRVSGCGDEWFQAAAPFVDGLYFSGYDRSHAAADLGDSAITETAGLGGFAMAAAPAIVGFVGGTASDAVAHTTRMRNITVCDVSNFTIASLDFAPIRAGIDVRAVIDTGILPVINTGIAHRDAGVGQIGAGITTAPFSCFVQAAEALSRADW
jgi:Protein of unknown function (DUF1116)